MVMASNVSSRKKHKYICAGQHRIVVHSVELQIFTLENRNKSVFEDFLLKSHAISKYQNSYRLNFLLRSNGPRYVYLRKCRFLKIRWC